VGVETPLVPHLAEASAGCGVVDQRENRPGLRARHGRERGQPFAAVLSVCQQANAIKDDLAQLDKRIDKLDAKIDDVESSLAGKINRLYTKLTKFEEHEIDKRKRLEVRVTAIENHLGLDKKSAA
jgi:cell division protein FtsB